MSSIAPNWHPWLATSYRTALAAAVIAYGVIIHGARSVRELHVFWSIAVLNLGLALVWFFSEPYPLTVLPFSIWSARFIMSFIRVPIVRTAYAQEQHTQEGCKAHHDEYNPPIAPYFAAFSGDWAGFLKAFTRIMEVVLWVHLFYSTVLGINRSYYLIVGYTVFLGGRWARYHAGESWDSASMLSYIS